MKPSLFLLILWISFCSCGQKPVGNPSNYVLRSTSSMVSPDFSIREFAPIPEKYSDRQHLIDQIIPVKKYLYWECVFKDPLTEQHRGSITVYNGNTKYSVIAKAVNTNNGFFVECHPSICFSYIVGVNEDQTIDLINSGEALKKFIGRIDNLEEVILMAKINGYWFDTDTIIGGAYKERENDYLLYLMEYSSAPVTYRSVQAILTKEGDFRVLNKSTYKQSEEMIVE